MAIADDLRLRRRLPLRLPEATSGLNMFGGCCGTTPDLIKFYKREIKMMEINESNILDR